jgi:hypothetical protein
MSHEKSGKKPRSCWKGATPWSAAKALSNVFKDGAVLVVTFVASNLIPSAKAEYCFQPNGTNTFNLLDCDNIQQESNLSRDLEIQGNAKAAHYYQCMDTFDAAYKAGVPLNSTSYGRSPLGFAECKVYYNGQLDSTVDSILKPNVQSGILGNWDIGAIILIVGAGLSLGAVVTLYGCSKLKQKWRREALASQPVDGNETTANNEVEYVGTPEPARKTTYQGLPRPRAAPAAYEV